LCLLSKGNMWAQTWSNIMPLVIPFANRSSPNVTKELVEQVSQLNIIIRTEHYTYILTNPCYTIRYDTIGEFNVDSKAEYSALSSTHSQKKTKTNNASAPLIQYRLKVAMVHDGTCAQRGSFKKNWFNLM